MSEIGNSTKLKCSVRHGIVQGMSDSAHIALTNGTGHPSAATVEAVSGASHVRKAVERLRKAVERLGKAVERQEGRWQA